jgi:hypothetical protein
MEIDARSWKRALGKVLPSALWIDENAQVNVVFNQVTIFTSWQTPRTHSMAN